MRIARSQTTWAASALAAMVLAAAVGGCSESSAGSASSTSPTSPTSPATATSAAACSAGAAPSLSGQRTAYATTANLESTQTLAGQVGQPTLSQTPSGVAGWDLAGITVDLQVRTNGTFAVSPASFVLVSPAGQRCAQPATNPLGGSFTIMQVDQSHPGSGEVAFLVPHGTDLSGYSVMYTDQAGGKVASAQWDADAPTPSATATAGCDGKKSTYDVAKVERKPFGTAQRAGSGAITVIVDPQAPVLQDLPPAAGQPTDVDGVQLKVTVTAEGSVGFVERGQFQLVDARGMLCRYSQSGSTGETLTSDLVPAGQQKTYTLVFWLPRGSAMNSWTLLYVKDPTSTTVSAAWTGRTVPASANPSPTPSATTTTTAGQPTKG
ncbi:hypothetical protein [Branchiibius sp. NY16-3462-2]|uniref:hypothetical protein n=1 Tax=Branchiibius sp. NY16-3462-2 TaxID=1807500 RepID=UPI0007918C3A|nr:hypothetical protein [Branchiibius sp. NY16-3462-2]KYH45785.1 hypothetical protein AZH51_08830 [Branchiibius sp. NY16-3462-2]